MLHARGVDGCVFKAFVAPGSNGQSAVQDKTEVNLADLSVAWRIAMRNILRPGEESRHMLAASCQRLPRIVLLRQGQFQIWTSAVQHALDFVDVLCQIGTPSLQNGGNGPDLLNLAAYNFTRAASTIPLLLVTFTTRWCARCIDLTQQLQRAADLIAMLKPPVQVSLARVDMSDPANVAWLLEDIHVFSFPVGRMYHYGAFVGTYLGGPSGNTIAQEMLRHAEDFQRVSRAAGGQP